MAAQWIQEKENYNRNADSKKRVEKGGGADLEFFFEFPYFRQG
jgi:hypothetical protein